MNKEINSTQYQEGILDVCDFLVVELTEFLKDEGRYKYRMLDYIKSIKDEFDITHASMTEDDTNIYGRVLYVLKKSIIQDYKRLRIRRLSPADSVLCIILKLINVSESIEGQNRYTKEQGEIKKVIQKLYDNIRNKAKYDHLKRIEESIKTSIETKKWGTLSLDELNLYNIEHPDKNQKSRELVGEKNTWGSSNGKEVNF